MERASNSYSGTPAYSSPEQASCQPVDGRSDQYSLAVICYELLLGRRLFASKDAATMLLHQIRSPVPDPREFLTDLDDAIADAIVRALLKNPDERFATCQEFAVAIGDQLTASSNPVVGISEKDRLSHHICYSPQDSILASKLAHALEDHGYSCWLSQRDALPGVSLQLQVKSIISRCHAALLLISRSLIKNAALLDEIANAHQLGRTLFPLLVDMSQEEFDTQNLVWRSMLGPSALLPLHSRQSPDAAVERIMKGADAIGLRKRRPDSVSVSRVATPLIGRVWATDANQIDIRDLDRLVFRNEAIDDFLLRRNKSFCQRRKDWGRLYC